MDLKIISKGTNQRINLFLPIYSNDVVLVTEKKVNGQWLAEERTILPRAIFEDFSMIKHGGEFVLPHSEVVPDFHSVELEPVGLQVKDCENLTDVPKQVREKFMNYELSCQPMYENQLGHLRDRELYEALWQLDNDSPLTVTPPPSSPNEISSSVLEAPRKRQKKLDKSEADSNDEDIEFVIPAKKSISRKLF